MQNLALLCGGRSAEYPISLVSAQNIYQALASNDYQIHVIEVQTGGAWLLQNSDWLLKGLPGPGLAVEAEMGSLPFRFKTAQGPLVIDMALPIFHGTFGEDGTVQGFLKTAGLPFIGVSLLGSALSRDKDVMKRLLQAAGLPVTPMRLVRREDKAHLHFEELVASLGLPFFLKPCNLGSSIGVAKIKDEASFWLALEQAWRYDPKVLLETYVAGRELECAILGHGASARVSPPGLLKPRHEFYSYEAKYEDPEGASFEIPAQLNPEQTQELQALALKAMQVLECEGIARIDFFLSQDGKLFINEINTLPGFTAISMYPKLLAELGLSVREIIEELMALAQTRFAAEQALALKQL